jgi:hypothetical protein
MKLFFLLLLPLVILSLSGCTPKYDYTIHKPKVKYKKPTKDALARTLKEKLGTEYVWAEEGPKAFDCSGLTYYSYGRMNMTIPRVAREQAKVGQKVALTELAYGDLIFFNTTKKRSHKITHVGIYIGNGQFQHAANKDKGVIITKLTDQYYAPRIVVCKRYLPTDTNPVTPFPTMPLSGDRLAHASTPSTITPLRIQEQVIQQTPQSGHHYIQVGTFSHTPSQGLFQQIKNNGYRYKVLQVASRKKVLIGPYQSKAQALKSLDRVRSTILPDAFTVKI